MLLNIIHLPHRTDRMETLQTELAGQEISDFRIWNGIIERNFPRRGISKAHKQIVFHAKKNKLPHVLICEDDICFSGKGAFDYYLSKIPEIFDIYLGGVYYGDVNDANLVDDFSGLTLYLVHAGFYDTFLSLPEHLNIDRALKGHGLYVVCDPFVVRQHNGYSDNTRQRVNYDHWLVNRKFYEDK